MLRWSRYIAPLVRLAFRPAIENPENLPATGPYLLVANHSGLGNPDIACLIATLPDLNRARFPAAMVHPVSFNSWPAGRWMARLGAIPSTYEAAQDALSRGVPVLVFPGGDIEATRPIWLANQVDFGGRKGFLKIAREAEVPLVPMGIRGSHFTAPILFRSKTLSKVLIVPYLMGARFYPVTLLGVLGALALVATPGIGWPASLVAAYLWNVLPVSQLPFVPWTVRIRVGTSMPSTDLFPDSSDVTLERAYNRVRDAIEELVNTQAK